MRDSDNSGDEVSSFLWCYAVEIGKQWPTFWRGLIPSASCQAGQEIDLLEGIVCRCSVWSEGPQEWSALVIWPLRDLLLNLTEECAVDLGSCLRWQKPTISCLWPVTNVFRRFQWPRALRRRSAAARLLRSWVRIPPGAWMFVYCEFCVLWGRGLYDELITRPEESYRLWCVIVCDLENLVNEEAMTRVGSQRHRKNNQFFPVKMRSASTPLCFMRVN